MTILLVVAASIQIVSSAVPLSPEQAAAVLRACQCLSNRTEAPPRVEPPAPSVVVVSDPRSGPFGPLHLSPSRPTCCDMYVGPWPVFEEWRRLPATPYAQPSLSWDSAHQLREPVRDRGHAVR
jgi:hypothetical protein